MVIGDHVQVSPDYVEMSINGDFLWIGLEYNGKMKRWEFAAQVAGLSEDDDDVRLNIMLGIKQAVSNCLHSVSRKKALKLGKELEEAAAFLREWVDS